ncbi:excinuclease ABC subunit UvrA [Corynebacterium pseudodiphtheriticum]|uniref:excinuclease ABC subunit UvrA n=1 Tax=Corynebacterium pseudodiphtheriticum TaxID=37637 RepID=UPI002550A070|nr:excinuclease ABC subunit UvrA [Corynebacterium pseudodiphtheriticum]MDK8685325.1 excinuclease ABC subunit UvrA [Corynebacterium pseudodiphtheriticum]
MQVPTCVSIHDAHLHNLRHIDVTIPHGQLVAFTGISGSGKSSLAFGTIHGEGQRSYLESVAPFARRLISQATDPQVGSIEGLSPTVALQQQTTAPGARSTVGTISSTSNIVRLLYSRCGDYSALSGGTLSGDAPFNATTSDGAPSDGAPSATPITRLASDVFSPNTADGMCPECRGTGTKFVATEASMVHEPELSIRDGAITAWPGAWAGKNFRDILEALGYDLDRPWQELSESDRNWILFTRERPVVEIVPHRGADQIQRTYQGTWRSVAEYLYKTLRETESDSLRRRTESFLESHTCSNCGGAGLRPQALQVRYLGVAINELNAWSLDFLHQELVERQQELGQRAGGSNAARDDHPGAAAAPATRTAQDDAEALLLTQIIPPLAAALELGLGHLSLDRAATTLSAGELQRLRLASQLHSSLFGVTYILDEPTAGLHPQERTAVLTVIRRLLAAGNNVFVVEHDMDFVAQADYLIDIGPYAGDGGGTVVFAGKPSELVDDRIGANGQSAEYPTARALANRHLQLADAPREANGHLELQGINHRNLRELDLELGLGQFTAVAGVSGSGKSTLVTDVVGKRATEHPDISRVVTITQKPIGRTPRSTLATYTGMFDRVRSIFAAQARRDGKDAKKWNASKFSYNTKKGQCPECSGAGHIEVELVFLPGTYTLCPRCQGGRFNDEALEVRWHGRTVADVLQLRVTEALEVFRDLADGGSSSGSGSGTGSDGATGSTGSDGGSKDPDHSQITQVVRALEVLDELGLGYLRLGQGAPELSGGEAQRIKLATELQRTQKKSSVYLLDEPTMGLHPHDSAKLLDKLEALADAGATVVMVEHNLEALARVDRVIELGPGAGAAGGRILAQASPKKLAEEDIATGRELARRVGP